MEELNNKGKIIKQIAIYHQHIWNYFNALKERDARHDITFGEISNSLMFLINSSSKFIFNKYLSDFITKDDKGQEHLIFVKKETQKLKENIYDLLDDNIIDIKGLALWQDKFVQHFFIVHIFLNQQEDKKLDSKLIDNTVRDAIQIFCIYYSFLLKQLLGYILNEKLNQEVIKKSLKNALNNIKKVYVEDTDSNYNNKEFINIIDKCNNFICNTFEIEN